MSEAAVVQGESDSDSEFPPVSLADNPVNEHACSSAKMICACPYNVNVESRHMCMV